MTNQNTLISNVILNWARLDQPAVNQFNDKEQWELQIATDSAEEAHRWEHELKLNVKADNGLYYTSVRRHATLKDGSPNEPVRVVDSNKQPLENRMIGNGSKGNVIIWQGDYDFAGRQGVYTVLVAVQVVDLVEYTPSGSLDFDVVDTSNVDTGSIAF